MRSIGSDGLTSQARFSSQIQIVMLATAGHGAPSEAGFPGPPLQGRQTAWEAGPAGNLETNIPLHAKPQIPVSPHRGQNREVGAPGTGDAPCSPASSAEPVAGDALAVANDALGVALGRAHGCAQIFHGRHARSRLRKGAFRRRQGGGGQGERGGFGKGRCPSPHTRRCGRGHFDDDGGP